jgi:hypothetical protein
LLPQLYAALQTRVHLLVLLVLFIDSLMAAGGVCWAGIQPHMLPQLYAALQTRVHVLVLLVLFIDSLMAAGSICWTGIQPHLLSQLHAALQAGMQLMDQAQHGTQSSQQAAEPQGKHHDTICTAVHLPVGFCTAASSIHTKRCAVCRSKIHPR